MPAACSGRACESSVIPSSSRACTRARPHARSALPATCSASLGRGRARGRSRPAPHVRRPGRRAARLLEREIGPLGVGLRAHRHVLARRHRGGAGDQAGDARGEDRRRGVESAAATPTMIAAVETMPSLAPSTAARSHPVRWLRCRSGCRIRGIRLPSCRSRDDVAGTSTPRGADGSDRVQDRQAPRSHGIVRGWPPDLRIRVGNAIRRASGWRESNPRLRLGRPPLYH